MPEPRSQFSHTWLRFEERDAQSGLVYRLAKTEEDVDAVVRFMYDVFFRGTYDVADKSLLTTYGKRFVTPLPFQASRASPPAAQVEGAVRGGATVIAVDGRTGRLEGINVSVKTIRYFRHAGDKPCHKCASCLNPPAVRETPPPHIPSNT